MQGCQAIDVGGVDVGTFDEQPLDLILVGGRTGCQEDAAVGELDLLGLPLGLGRLLAGLAILPAFQLLGPLEQRRSRSGFKRTHCLAQYLDPGTAVKRSTRLSIEKTTNFCFTRLSELMTWHDTSHEEPEKLLTVT